MKKIVILIVLTFVSIILFAFELELKTAAHRPGTNEVFVGGTFNTVIVFDIKDGKTLRTFELPEGILDMQFSKSANVLLTVSSTKIYLINPEDGTITSEIKGSYFQVFANSPYFIDVKKYGDTRVIVYNAENGERIKEVRFDFQPKICGFDKNFKNLFILSDRFDIDEQEEQKLLTKQIEKISGYNSYNSAYVAKQSDKKASLIAKFDTENFELVETKTCAFDFTGSFALTLVPLEESIYISDWDMLIKIEKNGKSTAIECDNSVFAYANAVNPDFNSIVIASTKSGNIFSISDNTWMQYNLKESNEFAYTTDIFFVNGNSWLLSKDYTLAAMNEKGEKIKHYKIIEGSEKGFSVYYHNGYSKKEDRDKEAEIINSSLKNMGLAEINLDDFVGRSDVVLAIFKTVTEADNFVKVLKDNRLNYITKIAPAK